MKKYLYLPCLALLALAACDDKDNADQQSQIAPPTATEEAVVESVAPDGTAPVAEVVAPATPEAGVAYSPTANPALSGDTTGNAGPAEGMVAEETPPAPNPETFNEEKAAETTAADTTCGDYANWVGQPVDEAAVKATGKTYRIVKPGDPMTMDHSPDRVNVEHDDANIVTRVWCG